MVVALKDPETNHTLFTFFSDFNEDWQGASIFKFLLYLVILVLAVAGNGLVIIAFCRTRQLRIVANYFVVNMAATDLLRVCTFSLKAATFITKDWIFGSVVCKLSIYLESMCAANTIHCLMYISLERYMYICKPPDKKLTARKVLLIIGITWAYTLAAPVLMVFLWAVTEVEFEGQVYSFCGEEPSMKMFGFRLRLIYIALFYYIVPILFTCLNYFRIYRTVRQSTNRVNNKLGSSSRNGKAQLRLVTMFIVSITFFVLMWVPLYIHEIIRTLTEMSDNTYFIIISLIALTNTFQNPIIYGYYNKFFNDEFRKMCCCKSIPLRKGATISTMQSHVSHTDVSKAL